MSTQQSSSQFGPETQATGLGLSQDPSFSFLDAGTQDPAGVGHYPDFSTFSQV